MMKTPAKEVWGYLWAHGDDVKGLNDTGNPFDTDPDVLDSLSEESAVKYVDCVYNFLNSDYPPQDHGFADAPALWCNSTWDKISCWPTTPAGSTAVIACMEEFNGIRYDTTKNATRQCLDSGIWSNYSNYESCYESPLPQNTPDGDDSVFISENTTIIYFAGYSVSLLALTVALWIFTRFRDLRCLRNIIHTHLFITYIMADTFWILTATLQSLISQTNYGSCIIVIFLHYFHLTNFFWMFVEGFYLYMLVVQTFSADKIKLRVYALIGWGAPLPVVIVWAVVKAYWHKYPLADGIKPDMEAAFLLSNCPWIAANSYDWIYVTPALSVLFLNVVFLFKVMWVLITKLRSANSVETQQYRKGSKALLVLIPLLGLTYVLVIAGPTQGVLAVIFSQLRAFLLSIQGFTVALFYCFLNTEVRNTVLHHWERWQEARSLGNSHPHPGRDGSPRTRPFSSRSRKRDTSFSEVTTVTTYPVSGGNGNGYTALQPPPAIRLSNGNTATTAVIVAANTRASNDSTSALLVKENQV